MPTFDYHQSPPAGLVAGYEGNSVAVKVILGVLISIALYNAIELTILIFMTFHHYRGLYFWSILLSNLIGIIPSTIGALLHFFAIGPLWLSLTLSNIGFYFMIPGQSVVLYSRLHLVCHNQRILRSVLWLIVIDTIILVIPTTTLTFGSAFVRTDPWNNGYNIMERVQVTWFCGQEFLISSLYIWETVKLLRLNTENRRYRENIMYELLAINLIIIMMDVALLAVEYLNFYYIQVTLKSTVYSIKLKLEFAVLGRLVSITNIHQPQPAGRDLAEFPDFINQAYTTSDFSHAALIDGGSFRFRRPERALSG
ncbi:hypothetical protein V499_04079 [Pseudogymnoascus sp. VKM F-103]|nr:hypothetical protein V499_04079 [Pseudogymnoascus sp. VKM F-103]